MSGLRIIDYYVLTGTSPRDLSRKVKDAIKKGWQPYGSGYGYGTVSHAQPVVVYELDGRSYVTVQYEPLNLEQSALTPKSE